ncbi:hypothetical protein AURDEDRAFT_163464 [Auricularia subglabra TFB-10046 SS5]|nr:hypothetical protein AURDEDRAFT_163464 [Auricularia subglabra TFB-10046 SS5]
MEAPAAAKWLGGALLELINTFCTRARQQPDLQSRVEALRHVKHAIESLRPRVLRDLNDVAPLHLLPRSILWRILDDVRDCNVRPIVTVCQLWRELPWKGDVHVFSETGALDGMDQALETFGTDPVTLDLTIFRSCDDFAAVFMKHASHVRSLICTFQLPVADRLAVVLPLLHALEEQAPLLEVCKVDIESLSWSSPIEPHAPDSLFGDSAPLLRSFTLVGIALRDRPYAALTRVKYLQLSQSSIDVVRVLGYYPHLQEFHVDVKALATGRRKINHRSLRLLQLPASSAAVDLVCKRLVLTRPLVVWMDRVPDEACSAILSGRPKHTLRRLQYILDLARPDYEELSSCPCCVLGYEGNIAWVFRYASPLSRLLFADSVFMSGLRELTVHELLWPADCTGLPTAPRLATLKLILDRFAPCSITHVAAPVLHDVAGVFYDASQLRCVLPCPALDELRVAVPASQSPLAIDVLDLCAFLRTTLRFEKSALSRLVLCKVHLYDPRMGQGMQLLTSCVSDVQYIVPPYAAIPHIHRDEPATWWIHDMMR